MGLTIQKIAGAILFALILLWGAGILSRIVFPEPEIQVAERPAPAGETAPTATVEPETPFAELLAAGDAEAGKGVARKCAACHTFDPGAGHRVGPNLAGIVGAPVAAKEGFAYSEALRQHGGAWDYERLSAFLAKPSAAVPGTKMTFAGLGDAEDRADMIAYLRSLSPDAPPLPQSQAGEGAR